VLDRIEADGAELKGLLHSRMQIGKLEAFQQAQNLHILAPAMLCYAGLHQAEQRGKLFWQVPILKRGSLIQRVDLLFDQRQIMQRIEDDVFPFPTAGMTGDDLAASADHHFVHIAPDPDLPVAIGDRNRVVVGLVADQRLRRHSGAGLVASIEGRCR